MINSIKQLLRSLILATQALLAKGKSGEVSDSWRETELWRYEDSDKKAGGLY